MNRLRQHALFWAFGAFALAAISLPHIVARLRLDLAGTVTARAERCYLGRCDVVLTLDQTREVVLGFRDSETYDLRALKQGQRFAKHIGDLSLVVDGESKMWSWWGAIPLFASLAGSLCCVVRSLQLLRRSRKPQ